MARYELSLSPTYVKHWTYLDAVREIFQNAIDQETVNPDNAMAYSYDGEILRIHSTNSFLDKSSLLLGMTTKQDDRDQIGSFGEGYKLALLVLSRENFEVVIHNNYHSETWRPKIIKSRRYGSDLLVVDVDKSLFKKADTKHLVFEINGITQNMFDEIKKRMLFLQDDLAVIHTSRGDILLDKDKQGEIYVNGLFVEKMKGDVLFGYNMKAKAITLDRDRRAVDVFQLTWDTSWMWSSVSTKYPDLFLDLLHAEAMDIQYITNSSVIDISDTADIAYSDFVSKYGKKAIPVGNQMENEEASEVFPSAKIIMVGSVYSSLLKRSTNYLKHISSIPKVEKPTPHSILRKFAESYRDEFSDKAAEEFASIISQSITWRTGDEE